MREERWAAAIWFVFLKNFFGSDKSFLVWPSEKADGEGVSPKQSGLTRGSKLVSFWHASCKETSCWGRLKAGPASTSQRHQLIDRPIRKG